MTESALPTKTNKTKDMQPNIVFLDEYSLGGADLDAIRALGDYTGYETTAREEVVGRCREAATAVDGVQHPDRLQGQRPLLVRFLGHIQPSIFLNVFTRLSR